VALLEMFVELLGLQKGLAAVLARQEAGFLFMHIPYVSNHIVRIQKLLEANVALVVSLSSVTLHVTPQLRFRVKSKAANLRNIDVRFSLKNPIGVLLTSHFSALKS
jgi:hypothetical protein